jgi:hypothetical protein
MFKREVGMKKVLISVILLFPFQIPAQKANHLVIAEVFAAGGNSGAVYKYDYIVLYNPTLLSMDISNYSLQYATATGTNYEVISLINTINAESYYLVKLASSGDIGIDLPITPDLTYNLNLNSVAGKIAIVNNKVSISGLSDVDVIDFLGYGGSPSEYEGTGKATYPTNFTKSLCRKDNSGNSTYGSNGSGWDSNDNNSDFFQNASPSPLPVELSYFSANVEGAKVNLTWSTATEVNNYGFNIERRIQNEEWKKIGFVPGSGNSNSPKSYTFLDLPLGGIYFKYRLKQIDFDGTYEYSNEVDVTLNRINNFTLEQNYPNPFNPTTTIRFSLPIESFVTFKVFNLLGEQVSEVIRQSLKKGFHEIKFDGSNLASGVYFYHLNAGDFNATRKFIVAR